VPLPTENAPWNFYRLGLTREKELFKRRRDAYSGVLVPAHIASYYAKFCTEFIGSLQKPYFIDPITYIFARQHSALLRYLKDRKGRTKRDIAGNKQKGDLKRSFRKIVDSYGTLVSRAVANQRALELSDFSDNALVSEFVANVIDFQRSKLASLPEKYKKYEKYARLVGRSSQPNLPVLLIAPYFSIEDSRWIAVNIDLIKRSKKLGQDLPVFATIAAPLESLRSARQSIVQQFKSADADGFFLWINDFTGMTDLNSIRIAKDFVKELATLGKPIVSLYGDAYSLVLKHFGLTGYACGICYGEKRSVDQDSDVEGQIPPRYYLSALKKKIELETEARRRDPRSFPVLVCPCDVCERTTNLAELDEMQTREHFMLARAAEIGVLRSGQTSAAMAQELRLRYEEFKGETIFAPVQHLNNWARILEETS
jgi:hypothetical protein